MLHVYSTHRQQVPAAKHSISKAPFTVLAKLNAVAQLRRDSRDMRCEHSLIQCHFHPLHNLHTRDISIRKFSTMHVFGSYEPQVFRPAAISVGSMAEHSTSYTYANPGKHSCLINMSISRSSMW